jgi:hypothetical protein
MAVAAERIVVQATAQDKKAIVAKAKKLDMPVAELMRRGAHAYQIAQTNDELSALAEAARQSAERSGQAIDEALSFIEASNRRIAVMEASVRPKSAVKSKSAGKAKKATR